MPLEGGLEWEMGTLPAGRTGRLSSISVACRVPRMLDLLRPGAPGLDIVGEARSGSSRRVQLCLGVRKQLRRPVRNQDKDE